MAKKQKQKLAPKKVVVVSETRQSLMLKAKDRGIKNFRVLNKEELQAVLVEEVTQEQIDNVVSGAVARWKSGWGSKKVES